MQIEIKLDIFCTNQICHIKCSVQIFQNQTLFEKMAFHCQTQFIIEM
jgi:hypothetical protein